MTRRDVLLLLGIALALSSCAYEVRFDDCAVRCSIVSPECPDDLACDGSFCRTTETTSTCAEVLGTFPSCAGLAATCGPNKNEDCCSTAALISSGTFYRSYDVAGDGMYPSTSYPATVSPFMLDRFEVTVGRFRKFVEAGMGTRINPPSSGAGARWLNGAVEQGGWNASWDENLAVDTLALVAALKCDVARQSWTDTPDENEVLPINCVTWYEAFAFCEWDEGFLPTEAEWNYVASGGSEHRAYPWSDPPSAVSIDCGRANYRVDSPPETACLNGAVGAVANVGSTSPKGDAKWGQADLAGNVWEWVLDRYGPYEIPCYDCSNLTAVSPSIRGGHFGDTDLFLRGSFRNYAAVQDGLRRYSIGLRCARETSR